MEKPMNEQEIDRALDRYAAYLREPSRLELNESVTAIVCRAADAGLALRHLTRNDHTATVTETERTT